MQLLAERISAAALVLRDVSLIFLRREAQAERDIAAERAKNAREYALEELG